MFILQRKDSEKLLFFGCSLQKYQDEAVIKNRNLGFANHLYLLFGIVFCLFMLCSGPAIADFNIAVSSQAAKSASLAYNSKTRHFAVAYLSQHDGGFELILKRFNESGQLQQTVRPFGDPGSVDAIGRPAISYSPNSNLFLVAVPERRGDRDNVIARFLDGDDQEIRGVPEFLFFSPAYRYYDRDGVGTLRITHNSLLDEFVVSVQRRYEYTNEAGVWAQRINASQGILSTPKELESFGVSGYPAHSIAYAPVPSTTPAGGRYLFVSKTWLGPELLDSQLTPIVTVYAIYPGPIFVPFGTHIPVNWGKPKGDSEVQDIAYGEVKGNKRFLMVYSDEDNECPPGTGEWCTEWTGIWGAYIDPERLFYLSAVNSPFPISLIGRHFSPKMINPKARVDYHKEVEAFFVAWYEMTQEAPFSHIRGVWVDYFVEDRGYVSVPIPHENIIVSDTTGGGCDPIGFPCRSLEDPDFPAVSQLGSSSAVVVWQQRALSTPQDLDLVGDTVNYTSTTFTCPSCSGVDVVVQNELFPAGCDCQCNGTKSITAGPNVKIKPQAKVRFVAPKVTLKPGVFVEEGAHFKTNQ